MKEKLMPLAEAAGVVRDGALLGLGTGSLANVPMAFLREVLRRGLRDLRPVTVTGGGLNVDLLVGAGAVAECETCHLNLADYGEAPNFWRAVDRGSIKLKEST